MSIYWVKETVNADAVGTVDTYGDPYGIQKAFDLVSAGDEVRIVAGTNNYNSASTSWNNRDAANKTINVDGTSGTVTSPIKVSGYTDETTEGEATLDFDSAVITGGRGIYQIRDYYIWKNIRITDCDTDGWYIFGSSTPFYLCRGDNNGGIGIDTVSSGVRLIACQFDNNGGDGVDTSGRLYYCEVYNNVGDGQGGSADDTVTVETIFDGNGGYGARHDDSTDYISCTFEDNADGALGGSTVAALIFIDCGFTNNTGYGVDGAAGLIFMEINCGYYGNGSGAVEGSVSLQENRVTTDPGYADADNRDYSLGTNWKALGYGGFPSGDSVGYIDVGAVQREEAGGISIVNARRNTLIGR
jgi:hypothetical protein